MRNELNRNARLLLRLLLCIACSVGLWQPARAFAADRHTTDHVDVVRVQRIVDDLNQNLARYEKLKRVLLVADEFSAENGTLTASMKLRRKVVEERYRKQIDEMYEQAEEAGPGPEMA